MAGSGLAAQRVEIQLPPLFEWQKEVMADPARYRVILCARQIGKTVLSVWVTGGCANAWRPYQMLRRSSSS